jgi:phosphoribosylformimino-5-aminoimidazole carboxamide ribotide isomerase
VRSGGGAGVILYPAIDILDGNAVRLVKGDFDAKKVYDEDPLAAARGWTQAGAKYLHVVDLDGAKTGAPVNLEHLRRIASELGVPVQYGGGLRSAQAVSDALRAGAARVILGTAAFTQTGLLEQVLGEHGPERVLVSVDVRGGHVTTAGWTETTKITTEAVIDSLAGRGARKLVFTNVDRDGMLGGPDLEEVRRVAEAVEGSLIYSGGIGQLVDLEGLAELRGTSLEGVIVGKALYERRFTVAEGQAALAG